MTAGDGYMQSANLDSSDFEGWRWIRVGLLVDANALFFGQKLFPRERRNRVFPAGEHVLSIAYAGVFCWAVAGWKL